MDRLLAEHLAAPALAVWLAMLGHVRIEPDEPRAFSASLYVFQFVVRYF